MSVDDLEASALATMPVALESVKIIVPQVRRHVYGSEDRPVKCPPSHLQDDGDCLIAALVNPMKLPE